MPLAIGTPKLTTEKLIRSDASGDTFVTIRQAMQGQQEERARLFDEITRVIRDQNYGQVDEIKQRISMEELKRVEVRLTLVDCNILDRDGQTPLFTFVDDGVAKRLSMTETRFNEQWGKLPPEVAQEISEMTLKCNPSWSRKNPE